MAKKNKIQENKTSSEVIQESRMGLTLTITLIAWLFFAIIFGVVIGAQAISTAKTQNNILTTALQSSTGQNPGDQGGFFPGQNRNFSPEAEKCIIVKTDGNGHALVNYVQLSAYSEDIRDEIVLQAMETEDGRYNVGSNYFLVRSQENSDGTTTYAIMDVSLDRSQLIDVTLICIIVHCLVVITIGLLAFFLTKRALKPIAQAFEKQRELTANASHELKTPLTVISTNVSVIKSEPESTIKDNQKWIESIDTQVNRMNELIKSMLELSKMDSTKLLHLPLDFSDVTEGQCLDYEVVCFEKQIAFEYNVEPNLTILGDKPSLQRLVLILLDNATKYCTGEDRRINLNLVQEKKLVHLSVLNTGTPISEENSKRVFDRFYRADSSRTKETDSNSFGLGLSIAQSTVQDHGGKISCHGIENVGTQFDVYLPLPSKKEMQEAINSQKEIDKKKKEREEKREEYSNSEE